MNKQFWRSAAIRAIRTVCQTAVAMIGTATVVADVDWKMVISASIVAGILSVLTSISTGLPEAESAHELTDAEAQQMLTDFDGVLDGLADCEVVEDE